MFEDREDAGLKLCPKLKKFFNKNDCVVAGLTRGGVITAEKISSSLNLPLKVIVIKKIGAPENSELAIGAIISLKDIYWDLKIVKNLGISEKQKNLLAAKKLDEVKKLKRVLRIKTRKNEFKNKNIILVDDGVATGATVITAAKYLKRLNAKKIILATPVIATDTLISIKKYFDKVIYLEKRYDFYAVGQFYLNFEEIFDEKIAKILNI